MTSRANDRQRFEVQDAISLRLRLPIGISRLQPTRMLLVAEADVRLLAGKRDRALLVAGHAARVEQASPHEHPLSCQHEIISRRHEVLPVEEVHP